MSELSSYDEKNLLARVSAADPDAFRKLLEAYHYIPFRTAIKLLNDHSMAEDVVQEAFLKVWLHRGTLNDVASFGAWLRTITTNIIYDHLRKSKMEDARANKWYQEFHLKVHETEPVQEENYFEELITQAVSSLPPKQKEVFLLVKRQGYSREEASGLLNVSEETIKTHLERAMKFIRAYCISRMDPSGLAIAIIFLF